MISSAIAEVQETIRQDSSDPPDHYEIWMHLCDDESPIEDKLPIPASCSGLVESPASDSDVLGFYGSVFNRKTRKYEYALSLLPSEALPAKSAARPANHMRQADYVRDELLEQGGFQNRSKFRFCFAFAIRNGSLQGNSCANQRASHPEDRDGSNDQRCQSSPAHYRGLTDAQVESLATILCDLRLWKSSACRGPDACGGHPFCQHLVALVADLQPQISHLEFDRKMILGMGCGLVFLCLCVLHHQNTVLKSIRQKNTDLHQQNSVIKEQNTVLTQQNTVLKSIQQKNTDLHQQISVIREQNTVLTQKNAVLNEKNAVLNEQNNQLQLELKKARACFCAVL